MAIYQILDIHSDDAFFDVKEELIGKCFYTKNTLIPILRLPSYYTFQGTLEWLNPMSEDIGDALHTYTCFYAIQVKRLFK